MEKIVIRPQSKDILVNNSSANELSEVFSYDYTNGNGASSKAHEEVKRKLGSLFLVGHVEPKTEDTSYILSLIASLAKREYYASTDLTPKEAFSKTLRKINEALEDFFSKKDSKADIGVFAIATDNIYISKLGKFKIFLARDNQTIDVLNNISLFEKDRTKEKEFSNVISGKINTGDKILAFYPNRSISTRERFIKIDFLKQKEEEFIAKLASAGETKANFSFAGIHLNIQKFKEVTVEQKIVPPELKEPSKERDAAPRAILAKSVKKAGKESATIKPSDNEPAEASIPVHHLKQPQEQNLVSEVQAAPFLIPGEFSQAKKENAFLSVLSASAKLAGGMLNPGRNIKVRITAFTIIAVMVIGGTLVAKSFLFESAESKKLNAAITEAEMGLKLARTKISQNELAGAREILSASLINILSFKATNDSDRAEELTAEIIQFMDELDKAREAVISEIVSLPENIISIKKIKEQTISNINQNKYSNISVFEDLDVYEGNAYILTAGHIFRISDAATNDKTASNWLGESSVLPGESMFIVVDGDVYVLGKSGDLRTYFRGEQKSESSLSITLDKEFELLTHKDIPVLYLLDKKLSRVYVISKDSKTITETLKINTPSPIVETYTDETKTIYAITQDGKFWKVTP